MTFGFSSVLLQHGVIRHLVTKFYRREDDSDKQNTFDQSKISNHGRQYVEELELQTF